MRLEGVRVLVTRPRERAEELCFLLEDEGAQVVSLPLLELCPPDDPRPLRAAAEHMQRYTWVVFASPSAVQALFEAARVAGSVEHLYRAKIAAVGPKTAAAARQYGLNVVVLAEVATGDGLAQTLSPHLTGDDQVLLPAAQEGRRELEDALRAAGHRVTRVAAYQSVRAEVSDGAMAALEGAPPNVALFASPRTAEAFVEVAGDRAQALLRAARIVAIGPTTEHALEHLGLEVHAVAEEPTSIGLVEAAVRAVRG